MQGIEHKRLMRVGVFIKETFEQTLEEDEGVSQTNIWARVFQVVGTTSAKVLSCSEEQGRHQVCPLELSAQLRVQMLKHEFVSAKEETSEKLGNLSLPWWFLSP